MTQFNNTGKCVCVCACDNFPVVLGTRSISAIFSQKLAIFLAAADEIHATLIIRTVCTNVLSHIFWFTHDRSAHRTANGYSLINKPRSPLFPFILLNISPAQKMINCAGLCLSLYHLCLEFPFRYHLEKRVEKSRKQAPNSSALHFQDINQAERVIMHPTKTLKHIYLLNFL